MCTVLSRNPSSTQLNVVSLKKLQRCFSVDPVTKIHVVRIIADALPLLNYIVMDTTWNIYST